MQRTLQRGTYFLQRRLKIVQRRGASQMAVLHGIDERAPEGSVHVTQSGFGATEGATKVLVGSGHEGSRFVGDVIPGATTLYEFLINQAHEGSVNGRFIDLEFFCNQGRGIDLSLNEA